MQGALGRRQASARWSSRTWCRPTTRACLRKAGSRRPSVTFADASFSAETCWKFDGRAGARRRRMNVDADLPDGSFGRQRAEPISRPECLTNDLRIARASRALLFVSLQLRFDAGSHAESFG